MDLNREHMVTYVFSLPELTRPVTHKVLQFLVFCEQAGLVYGSIFLCSWITSYNARARAGFFLSFLNKIFLFIKK